MEACLATVSHYPRSRTMQPPLIRRLAGRACVCAGGVLCVVKKETQFASFRRSIIARLSPLGRSRPLLLILRHACLCFIDNSHTTHTPFVQAPPTRTWKPRVAFHNLEIWQPWTIAPRQTTCGGVEGEEPTTRRHPYSCPLPLPSSSSPCSSTWTAPPRLHHPGDVTFRPLADRPFPRPRCKRRSADPAPKLLRLPPPSPLPHSQPSGSRKRRRRSCMTPSWTPTSRPWLRRLLDSGSLANPLLPPPPPPL